MPHLVLGSSSPYRRELLSRLRLAFEVRTPNIDESPRGSESAAALAQRLAREKAHAVSQQVGIPAGAWIIGSDQVAECQGKLYGKPGNHEKAVNMLRELSGKTLNFHTGICLFKVGEAGSPPAIQEDVVRVEVRYRELSDEEIEHYLQAERPYDCAGAAKSEGLGISLLDYIRADDATALIGLPLIRLCQMLRLWGMKLPQ